MIPGVLDVGLARATPRYCTEAPYDPGEAYPEAVFPERVGARENPAYAALRELFVALGMDAERHGTPAWNPLGALVRPGDTVVLKPNFVVSRHASGGDLFSAITHPSLLRALADYVYLALEGRGRIVIADAPQMDCDWDELMRATAIPAVAALYRERLGFELELYDLRDFCLADPDEVAFAGNRRERPGDPAGEVVFDLAERSHLYEVENPERFYGADYDRQETIRNHHGRVQRYAVSRTVLAADVVISVPKLKVHKKVGVTLNVKGLVGINTNKNYLVHYRLGSPSGGGDQLPDHLPRGDRLLVRTQRLLYDRLLARRSLAADRVYNGLRWAYRAAVKPFLRFTPGTLQVDGGNWHGNDTAWRMALDLLRIFLYGDSDGHLHGSPRRRMLCVVDGIVGGDVDGPLRPRAVASGCLVGGMHPLAVDLVAARLMGFDAASIRLLSVGEAHAGEYGLPSPEAIRLHLGPGEVLEGEEWRSPAWVSPLPAFRPHPGWTGTVELVPAAGAA